MNGASASTATTDPKAAHAGGFFHLKTTHDTKYYNFAKDYKNASV